MRIPGIKSAKIFSRWVQARLFGGALILAYHRVAQNTRDEFDVCVSPEHFEEHMQVLSKYAHPIHLTKLVDDLRSGSLHPRSVAITFDDGYADNLYNAKPILEKYQVPATVFVCTGYLGGEFWWDELERLVMSTQSDLGLLSLVAIDKSFVWDQPVARNEDGGLDFRGKFLQAVYRFMLLLDVEEQNYAMERIRNWSGLPAGGSFETRSMNRAEVSQLSDSGLVEIGSHTRYHPMLDRLSVERQKDEIVSSKQELEEMTGKRVHGFAYPNGRATADTKRIVRQAGFVFACTSLHDVVRHGTDLHELTRFWQKDVDGEKFLKGYNLWTNSQVI